jgi:hypothetical protein
MEETKDESQCKQEEEFDQNDINREKFDYVVLGSGLTENILGA